MNNNDIIEGRLVWHNQLGVGKISQIHEDGNLWCWFLLSHPFVLVTPDVLEPISFDFFGHIKVHESLVAQSDKPHLKITVPKFNFQPVAGFEVER